MEFYILVSILPLLFGLIVFMSWGIQVVWTHMPMLDSIIHIKTSIATNVAVIYVLLFFHFVIQAAHLYCLTEFILLDVRNVCVPVLGRDKYSTWWTFTE